MHVCVHVCVHVCAVIVVGMGECGVCGVECVCIVCVRVCVCVCVCVFCVCIRGDSGVCVFVNRVVPITS